MRGVTAGIVLVAATTISTGYFLESDFTAKAVNELEANGVKMPVVSTANLYHVDKFVLNKNGAGTQYITMYDEKAFIQDMVTGAKIKTIFESVSSIIVNDKEDLFIGVVDPYYEYELHYATKFDDAKKIDTDIVMNKLHGFIQGTNIFIGEKYGVLKAYNFDTNQLVFETVLGESSGNLVDVKKDIAVANGKNVTIYDANGNYLDVLQFDSTVTAIKYSPNGQTLLVGTQNEDVQSFDVTSSYLNKQETLFKDTKKAENIVYDDSSDYLIIAKTSSNNYSDVNLRLFSLKDKQRIYTELDELNVYMRNYDQVLLSNNAKFIKYGDKTYNTKNIGKSPTAISIPKQYITMEAGSELKPTVTATLLDGTTTTVTDGVTWKSDDLSVAYYDESKNVFKPTEAGTFTLRASYLDFTTDVQVTVKKSALSGIKEYLAKHTKGGYYISNLGVKDIYLDQRIYKGASYKGQYVVTTFTGKKNGKPVTYLDVARKGKTAINFKQIELQANGKTFKKNTKAYLYKDGYESANSIKLSATDRKWIKDNVDPNKTVTAKLKGGKKTVTIKLSKTQKDALLKGVLVNDYLK